MKLLRFLESGEIRRVGETEPFRVDVRVLCATNRDLRADDRGGEFREDLLLPRQHVRDPPAAAARAEGRTSRDLARHLLAPDGQAAAWNRSRTC